MAGGMASNWENIFNQIGQRAERNIGKPTDFHEKSQTSVANNWSDA